ncbi:MAG TPA: ROK family protein [Thermoleophilaceae bacterium]|nr:ROK family protein [Thermoleophilaceae bacterium]
MFGIDVGGTKVAVARVEGAEATGKVEQATDLSHADALLEGIQRAVEEVTGDGPGPEAIGVGVPSQVEFATGTALASVNIPLEGVPLREELGDRFGVPVFVDNDANCAALAEAQLVPEPPAHHLVMMTLGTGVGGGVIIDGHIERGHTGLGAELGHVIVDGQTALAASAGGFPRPGSLEWHCSGRGLERAITEAARMAGEGPLARKLTDDGRVSGREAVAAAQEGDATALEVFARFARWLGLGIASFINTFEPERVVLGGGLSRAADLFLDDAKAEAERNTLPALWERVQIDLARGGADAGVIGAGVLAAQELKRLDSSPRSG